MKSRIKKIPFIGKWVVNINRQLKKKVPFSTSGEYWERRYDAGGNSGPGSYNRLAQFKAEVINDFVTAHNIRSIIDFGFGDGHQLQLINVPRYLGFEVSQSALRRCEQLFKGDPTKTFRHLSDYEGEQADLVLSLDVLYHLVEPDIFEDHLTRLFAASKRFVAIYASNFDDKEENITLPHVKRRKFTPWIGENQPSFQLKSLIPNRFPFDGDSKTTSRAEFYIYEQIRKSTQ